MSILPISLISLTILLHCITAQQTNGSVSVGASLTARPNTKPWLSSSGEFAFGFQQIQGENNNFFLSIWYDKIPEKTIVWYPNGGPKVSTGSKVELVDRRGLVLSDPQGKVVWSSGSLTTFAFGYMNNTGNFVIVGSNARTAWQSFDHPTDTILPTQFMVKDDGIHSKTSKTNFAAGKFVLRLLGDGNLVLNSVDMLTATPSDPSYYNSSTNAAFSSGEISGLRLEFDTTGYMYISTQSAKRVNLTRRFPSGDNYHRATLDSDGVFTQYYYPKNSSTSTSWSVIWYGPENICTSINSKTCGLYGVCSLVDNRPKCECPQGFTLVDPNTPNVGCTPDFVPTCNAGESNDGADVFDLIELKGTDWKYSDYEALNPSDEKNCRISCLNDCYCAVAVFYNNQCYKKQFPLNNGWKDASMNMKALVKFRKTDAPTGTGENRNETDHSGPGENRSGTAEDKTGRSLIFVGSTLLGTSLLAIVVLIGVTYACFFQSGKKVANSLSSTTVDTNLPRFTYKELVKATEGFKDELGKGAFGTVYKGIIGTKIVAVKKLESVFQEGQKEFESEVNTIGKTHHKNLVQLLGYCDDGNHRLLIYEYMSNGTLALLLFGDMRPSWEQRSYIAVGVAKGLAYLHDDCSNQIIHCDIKPQNILLDEYYNVKIADFGLAKLLNINQSRTNTGIRGTKGYVAPEWFKSTPVTFKVDVYSFGVLLLEIISCRKSVVIDEDNEDVEVLTDMASDCYQERKLDDFVKNDSKALDDFKKLTTFMMVGLWCIQENASLRPTMKKVIQMLEGVIEVTEPPCPSPISVTSF